MRAKRKANARRSTCIGKFVQQSEHQRATDLFLQTTNESNSVQQTDWTFRPDSYYFHTVI
jgi:hypothetical protein